MPCLFIYAALALAYPTQINDLPMVVLAVPLSLCFLTRYLPPVALGSEPPHELVFQDLFPLALRPIARVLSTMLLCLCRCCVKSNTVAQSKVCRGVLVDYSQLLMLCDLIVLR
jgi:hypothetical protein